MREKNLDMIIANTPAAIAAEESTVLMKTAGGRWIRLAVTRKAAIAERIIRQVDSL
jgi:phosphopantothenoylcysteine synthetase/decarboxylase